jgi:hypothetical protein
MMTLATQPVVPLQGNLFALMHTFCQVAAGVGSHMLHVVPLL